MANCSSLLRIRKYCKLFDCLMIQIYSEDNKQVHNMEVLHFLRRSTETVSLRALLVCIHTSFQPDFSEVQQSAMILCLSPSHTLQYTICFILACLKHTTLNPSNKLFKETMSNKVPSLCSEIPAAHLFMLH